MKCSQYDINFRDLIDPGLEKDYLWMLLIEAKKNASIVPCREGWNYDLDPKMTSIVADVGI